MKKSPYEFNPDAREDFYRYPQRYRIDAFRIYGNLYYVGNQSVGSHLIDTGEGLVLIDTTFPTTVSLLMDSIWSLGFNPRDIRYIIHTHGHFDHFGGTDLLVSLSGAKTYLGEGDARMFREQPELALIGYNRHSYLELFTPDIEMKDGDIIRLGRTAIKVRTTPGHSDGAVSLFFNVDEDGRQLVAGIHGGGGLNTMCCSFISRYGNAHCREEFIPGIQKVYDEHVDIMLGNHAGHNHTVEKRARLLAAPDSENPFINPLEWQQYLSGLIRKFHQMIAEEQAEDADSAIL